MSGGGLYNVVHGENPFGQVLVDALQGVQTFNVGRYRDAWVEGQGDDLLIRVHTRNGGGNREDYDDGSMQAHPWYVRDADGDFDNTYADYWFRPDPAVAGELGMKTLIDMAQEPVDMDARWADAIRALEDGTSPVLESPEVQRLGEQLREALGEP